MKMVEGTSSTWSRESTKKSTTKIIFNGDRLNTFPQGWEWGTEGSSHHITQHSARNSIPYNNTRKGNKMHTEGIPWWSSG